MDKKLKFFVVVVLAAMTGACTDSSQPGTDGKPQAAGAEDLRHAVKAYGESAPVRRTSQYAMAVSQGMFDPMLENAQRQAFTARTHGLQRNASRPLADDEHCVGSSIVRFEMVGKTPTYTQVLQNGRAIYCDGDVY
jgi:hypothetical protein